MLTCNGRALGEEADKEAKKLRLSIELTQKKQTLN